MKLIAFTVKGLEDFAIAEIIRAFPDARIITKESKCIIFDPKEKFENKISNLKIVDDICFWAYEFPLSQLSEEFLFNSISRINFHSYVRLIQKYRAVSPKSFSLTVSLPAVSNLKAPRLKSSLGKRLAKNLGMRFTEKDHENFDIRIFKGEEKVIIGVRITSGSLHHRKYKEKSKKGSLRPTIAAAMVDFATEGKKGKLLDPFCGSGTILAEAFTKGIDVYGSDTDKGSVNYTKRNLENLGFFQFHKVTNQSASSLNFQNNMFDFIVSNIPWGKQVEFREGEQELSKSISSIKRVIKDHATIVFLTLDPNLVVDTFKKIFDNPRVEQIKISFVGQQPTILRLKI